MGKRQKDFQYFFDELAIDYYIEDNPALWNQDQRVFSLDHFMQYRNDDFLIIICTPNPDETALHLEQSGLEHGRHFLQLEEMVLQLLLLDSDLFHEKFAVWGTGDVSNIFYNTYQNFLPISCYIDNDRRKRNQTFHGIQIKHPEDIEHLNDYFIIIANSFHREISEQLAGLGLTEGQDFVHSEDNRFRLAFLLLKTMHDPEKSAKHCARPFDTAYLSHRDGGYPVYLCCPYGLGTAIGDMRTGSFNGIWKSDLAKVVRLSVINKTYSFCNLDWCGDQWSSPVPVDYNTQPPDIIKAINIEFDQSCNLHCTFCRDSMELAGPEELEEMAKVADKTSAEVIPMSEHILLSSNGEVFFSKIYRRILEHRQLNNISHMHILSNGSLFTESKWKLLENNYKYIYLTFSINAASKITYEKLMRGGRFETTLRNLEFAGKLRKEGKVKEYVLNFVVQKSNFMEMAEFVRLAKVLNVDKVVFGRLNDGGAYTGDAFELESMFTPSLEMKEELKATLADPVFDDPMVTFMGGGARWGRDSEA
jgi:pyruvate-formate lyase-activating enzyme